MFDKTEKPRATVVNYFMCHAPEELIGDWDDLSDEVKKYLKSTHVWLPCIEVEHDGGCPGFWCVGCMYGEWDEE